jgi:hypothetical protein
MSTCSDQLKTSSKWELKNLETLEKLLHDSSEFFKTKYGYDLYKGNSGISQILGQAEIDVIGISFNGSENHIYAVDVAFHEAGLNYGCKEETVTRVIKKCIRTAMCILVYFEFYEGTIIFTSPKINPAVINEINKCTDDIEYILGQQGLNYEIRIIANDDFSNKILEPVLNVLGDVADTSELFMRSLQMYNLFIDKKSRALPTTTKIKTQPRTVTPDLEPIENIGITGLEEMKIGTIVRTVLRKILESNELSENEILKMQTSDYSKEIFDIQYPLLLSVEKTDGNRPSRYYANPLRIHGREYFLCSEWYETSQNNDRPYLMKWLGLKMGQ